MLCAASAQQGMHGIMLDTSRVNPCLEVHRIMFPVTRLYDSEDAARAVVDALFAGGFASDDVVAIYPSSEDAEALVDHAVDRGAILSGLRNSLKAALARGRSVVCARAAYGYGRFAEVTMGRGAVDDDTVVDYIPNDPAPFSDLIGMPVLSADSKSYTSLSSFDGRSSFGFKMISNNPTPLSSLFGMKLLSSRTGSIARGTAVERMSGNPAPLSSMIGLKLLTSSKGARGSSVERMSRNPAPFSNFFNLRLLSRKRA